MPLLKDPEASWDHVAITHLHDPGSYGLSARDWRYIHYANGDEELYHVREDPYEWDNLANDPHHADRLEGFRASGPREFAPKQPPSIKAMEKLAWHPAAESAAPASKPEGNTFDVIFLNRRDHSVELRWMNREGVPKSYGQIKPGVTREQNTRPGAVWQIIDPETGAELGHFVIGDRWAKGVIPR